MICSQALICSCKQLSAIAAKHESRCETDYRDFAGATEKERASERAMTSSCAFFMAIKKSSHYFDV